MKFFKKTIYWLFAVGLLFYIMSAIYSRLPIITGYAAKNMCSCVFVADREAAMVEQEDLNFFLVQYAKVNVDEKRKTATATVLGLAKETAVFREGLGCTLITDDTNEEELRKSSLLLSKPTKSHLDTISWPVGNLLNSSLPKSIDSDKLNRAVQKAFDSPDKKTRAVVVVYKDKLVAEKYAEGFDENTPQLGWSMTKSIINALTGIMVKNGKLTLEGSVPIKEWSNDDRSFINLKNLLQMSSGLDWEENYNDISNATRMLYLEGDQYNYAIGNKLIGGIHPGEEWYYSSGTTNIISGLIKNQFPNTQAYWHFHYDSLFHKIGMYSAVMEPDPSGTFIGSSYCYATPRDWAKFGMLYLNDGVWMDERILPEGWVEFTKSPVNNSGKEYGAQFWLNAGSKLPDVPKDVYFCDGFQGQRVFIIPSHEMVVVRLGISNNMDFNEFLVEILDALK
ncbi:serine hydrolase domain-containing protein [Flexithrix dorotheae]|uniref:serine hydrolase domain-containing protein n=1 Tax=Flexithrix dorotheae TaxID=70993 RepID=UPI000476659B|nr:serine hydrolase [Flexithrix dorotheae]